MGREKRKGWVDKLTPQAVQLHDEPHWQLDGPEQEQGPIFVVLVLVFFWWCRVLDFFEERR